MDFIEGVATAITPMALLETVMVTGYETVVDPDTKIDAKTGMLAACRLQELIDSREGQVDMARMWADMDQIIQVVKFDPSIPPIPGVSNKGGWAYRQRTPTDEDLLIRVNEYTDLTEQGRGIWRLPPLGP